MADQSEGEVRAQWHTHHPVPSNVKVSEELEKIIDEHSANVYICTYGGCGPKSSLRGTQGYCNQAMFTHRLRLGYPEGGDNGSKVDWSVDQCCSVPGYRGPSHVKLVQFSLFRDCGVLQEADSERRPHPVPFSSMGRCQVGWHQDLKDQFRERMSILEE